MAEFVASIQNPSQAVVATVVVIAVATFSCVAVWQAFKFLRAGLD